MTTKLEVVTKANIHLYEDAVAQMHDLRHRIFVNRMGWEALRKPDGIERDQFDTDDAIYLLLIDDETVIGMHRLLPTTKPHLFSQLFSDTCNVKGVQRGPYTYELNRTCVDEERLSKDAQRQAKGEIIVGLIEYCLEAGIETLTILTSTNLVSRYLALGWDIKPLGLPHDVNGQQQLAIAVSITQEAFDAVRKEFGILQSLVRYICPLPIRSSLSVLAAEPTAQPTMH